MKTNVAKSDRRTFIGSSLALGALLARPKRVLAANDRIAVAFIGVGEMGTFNLKAAMALREVQVAAVCDVYQPHVERASAAARAAGQSPKEIKDFREIIQDRSIDAVCISTPDHWHAYMAVEACKAGKDVYVEKPACLSIGEGLKMVEAARKYKRVVQAGTWQRSAAHFQRACELVRSQQLGTTSFCRAWIYQNMQHSGIGSPADSTPPPGLDWDLWLGPAEKRPFNANRFGVYPGVYSYFRYFWDYAGGHLTDSGVHMLDILQMAFGETMPRGISALGGKFWVDDNSETPDTMQASYQYSGFLGSWEHRCGNIAGFGSRQMGLQFHGNRGTLYVDRAGFELTPEKGSDLRAERMTLVAPAHPLHWVNFVDCVRSRERPHSDIETCFRSSATTILGNLSYRLRMRLDWDEVRATTVQPEARPYLEREHRQPWRVEV